MKDVRQSRRALLGGGLIVLLVGLAVGVFLMDDLIRGLRSRYEVVAVLSDAPGLATGAEVWVGGRRVGEVTRIGFLPRGEGSVSRIAATLDLPASVRAQVRADSRVRVTSARVVGPPVIDLVPGSPGTRALRTGDTLIQQPRPGREEVTARAQRLRAQLDSLAEVTAVLTPLADRRGTQMARLEQHLSGAQREYAALMRDVESSPALQLLGGETLATASERLSALLGELADAMTQAQQRLQTSGAAEGAERVRVRAAEVQAGLAALQAAMEDGTAMRLQNDSALIKAMARTRAELDSLLVEVRANPLRWVF